MAQMTKEAQHFALLDGHQYTNLTTYRKNGTDVTRPVWFAKDGETVYMYTLSDSGKVKHIRNNGDVWLSPCDMRGNPLSDERVAGTATIHEKGDPIADEANRVLNKKYGIQKRLASLSFWFRGGTPLWVRILPREA